MNTTTYPKPPFPDQDIKPPGLEADMDPAPRYRAPDYRSANKLHEKVALITGGDSGIGRAVALLYAREGAFVAFAYLEEEEKDAQRTAQEIRNVGGECMPIVLDVTDAKQCQNAVDKVIKKWHRLDILVNNAAFQKHRERIEELSEEQWDRTFKTNIYGYFYMTKAALPHLSKGSCIINTGSITGLEGSGGLLDYSATKGAIHAYTKSLSQQLLSRGIRVNCIAPGPVWTPLNPAERDAEEIKDFGKDTPLGRPAQPEEIAPAYVFFASNADSSFISGEVLSQLGGQTLAG